MKIAIWGMGRRGSILLRDLTMSSLPGFEVSCIVDQNTKVLEQ